MRKRNDQSLSPAVKALLWLAGFGYLCVLLSAWHYLPPLQLFADRAGDQPSVRSIAAAGARSSAAASANARADQGRAEKAPAANQTEWQGRVLSVGDGDTYWIENAGIAVKVRLADIDCPETDHGKKKPAQPWGAEAKSYAAKRIQGKTVAVRFRSYYVWGGGEIVAEILVDGKSLGPEMIDKGLAWWYADYSRDKSLGLRMQKAKALKLGLWSDPHAMPPWEYRRSLKKKAA
jgi:micrococcal nuclease